MKTIILCIICLVITKFAFGQNTSPRPTDSRFYHGKYSAFKVKAGDILVYSVLKDSVAFDLEVTILRYDSIIELNYQAKKANISGNIFLPQATVSKAYKYDTLVSDSIETLKDESVFWLSRKNFKELYWVKSSIMNLGNGRETFVRKNTGVLKLKIKGKEKLITVFQIQNRGSKSRKDLMVLTEDMNPLIIKMNVGWSMSLKEVR